MARAPTHIDDPKAMGARVRAARSARGLSLREAAFPGCSPSFLSRVEAGLRVPSQALLEEIAMRLGVPYDTLAGRPGQRTAIPERELLAVELAIRLGEAGERAQNQTPP